MGKDLLSVKNLKVEMEDKTILKNVDLSVGKGEVHGMVGPNGSGKSTLAMTLMGSKQGNVTSGQIKFRGKALRQMTIDERAREGLYVAWQNPVAIEGVSVFSLAKVAYENKVNFAKFKNIREFKQYLGKLAVKVGLTKECVERNVNEGFSGGEKKRLELLFLLLLKPKLAILDEIDSGLDKGGRQKAREIVNEMVETGTSFLIITHNDKGWDGVKMTQKWVMKAGKLKQAT